jgi:histidyl-tRNA synthetase
MIERNLRQALDIVCDVSFLDKQTIAQALDKSERRGYHYALVVGKQNEVKGAVNFNTLRQGDIVTRPFSPSPFV